jgi:hypothetical protein
MQMPSADLLEVARGRGEGRHAAERSPDLSVVVDKAGRDPYDRRVPRGPFPWRCSAHD